MGLEFKKRSVTTEFESPFKSFETVKISGEVRSCPFSNHVTRILPARIKEFARSDLAPVIARSKEAGCPFCPESIESKTPRFSKGFIQQDGRIKFEETAIFPNAFPYDEYSAVAVITREHFLSPGQFNPRLLQQAFQACLMYLRKAKEVFPAARQALLSWNYMPLAGAGIIHPHFQLSALGEPSAYYRLIIERQRNYDAGGERSIFDDLVAKELENQQRYLCQVGKWHWLTAFAPRGIYEIWAIFSLSADVLGMEDQDISDLAAGTHAVFDFLEAKGIQAFNMSWYSSYQPQLKGLRIWVSIVPRVNFPPLETSDINFFNRLQGESITFVPPEEVAVELRKFFRKSEAANDAVTAPL